MTHKRAWQPRARRMATVQPRRVFEVGDSTQPAVELVEDSSPTTSGRAVARLLACNLRASTWCGLVRYGCTTRGCATGRRGAGPRDPHWLRGGRGGHPQL